MKMDKELIEELRAAFYDEGNEIIVDLQLLSIDLEKAQKESEKKEILETIYRHVHNLKGASRAVEKRDVESECQRIEAQIKSVKEEKAALDKTFYDSIHNFINSVEEVINKDLDKANPPSSLEVDGSKSLFSNSVSANRNEVLKVSRSKFASALYKTEDMLFIKELSKERFIDLKEIIDNHSDWEKEWYKTIPIYSKMYRRFYKGQVIDWKSSEKEMRGLLDFLKWNFTYFDQLFEEHKRLKQKAQNEFTEIEEMVDGLQVNMLSLMMVPFNSLLESFPGMVHKLSKELDKNIEVDISGGHIEIDKRILDALKDPFMHLIRNCIDHGIEKSEVRIKAGKVSSGLIKIAIEPRNQKVVIRISDDGAGIDFELLKKKSQGQLKGKINELKSYKEIVFLSGISTREDATKVSGRGLGLAIVKERIEELGGTLTVDSQKGYGTMFTFLLPLAIAKAKGIVVEVSNQSYLVPMLHVEYVFKFRSVDLIQIDQQQFIYLMDKKIEFRWLADALGIGHTNYKKTNTWNGLVIKLEDKTFVLGVDTILGEQEVLIKNLGPFLKKVKNIAGASIIGGNRIIPILNIYDVSNQRTIRRNNDQLSLKDEHLEIVSDDIHVLVVDDSITTRSLIRYLLSIAGMKVTTAVDGLAAIEELGLKEFDIVISDVEMPRMNGIEMLRMIRANKVWSELPVVLVTGLNNKKDHRIALEEGANAYITKGEFDHNQLIETVNNLVNKEAIHDKGIDRR